MDRSRALVAIPLLVAIWGCSSQPTPPSSVGPSAGPPSASPIGSPSSEPSPSVAPSPSPTLEPTASPTPGAPQFPQDAVVQVVTDDLRVRSKPEVSDASVKLAPLLDSPQLLFVVDGPVEGSGYTWYEVAPIGRPDVTVELPFGWVAAADKDGTPWLTRVTPRCPARPTTVDALWTLDGVLGLACFGTTPITIDARLAQPEATCGVDIGWSVEPDWLGSTCPQPTFLIESRTKVGLSLNSIIDPDLDVSAFRPGVEPADWIAVRLTGQFDHPDATSCHGVSTSEPVPYGRDRIVLGCRATFAITGIKRA
jgi:hypothetical protein